MGKKYYRIKELADIANKSVQTLHYYRGKYKEFKELFEDTIVGYYTVLVLPTENFEIFLDILKKIEENKYGKKPWSKAAKECYLRGMNCNGCFYDEFCSQAEGTPPMKKTVQELLEKYGKPKEGT